VRKQHHLPAATGRKRTNRFTRATLAAIITTGALLVSGCSTGNGNSAAGNKKNLRIVQVAAVVTDPYFVSMKCGGAAEAAKLGVHYSFVGPAAPDPVAELSAFNNATTLRPDGIVLSPFSPTAFLSGIREQMSQGVPVTLVDGNSSQPVHYRWYHTDLAAAALALVTPISKATGGSGSFAVIASAAGDPDDTERFSSLIPILKKKLPGLNILSPQYVNTDTAKADSVTSSLLTAHPDLRAIYATNGAEAQGVVAAIKAAGRTGQVKVFSFDATPSEVSEIRAGNIDTTVAQSPYLAGSLGVRATVEYLTKHGTQTAVPFKLLNKNNIDDPASKPYLYLPNC
jgi:ribose transport system substrate-binding protein